MKRSRTKPISEVLKQYTDQNNLSGKLKEKRVIDSWESIIGKAVANTTQKIYIRDRIMFVYLRSAVVRSELMMIRSALLDRINETAGEKIIDKLVFK